MKQSKQSKQALENECGDTFVFCPSFYHQLRAIKSIETRLMVYEAVVEYGILGKVPDFSTVDPLGLIDGIFAAIKYVIDSTKSKRVHISNERSKAGKNGGAPKGNQNARKQPKTSKTNKTSVDVDVDVDVDEKIKKLSNESKESADKPRKVAAKRTAFVAPSPQEVKNYISEKGYTVDAQRFIDFYEAKGWMIGRNKMKNWRAAVRTWTRRPDTPTNQTSYETRKTNFL